MWRQSKKGGLRHIPWEARAELKNCGLLLKKDRIKTLGGKLHFNGANPNMDSDTDTKVNAGAPLPAAETDPC